MKSKLPLIIVGLVVVFVILLSVKIQSNKQSTSSKAIQSTGTIDASSLIKITDDSGKQYECIMDKGVCKIFVPSSNRISIKGNQVSKKNRAE